MLINLRNALMTGKRLSYDAEVEYLRVDAVGPYIVIDGVTYCNAVGTYYAFTISSGGVVTHDLIPVRLGNTGYMYDRITNKRFGNAGTGDFVLGPDVVPVEWLSSDGNAYINTGVYGSQNLRTKFDFQLIVEGTMPSARGLFGCFSNAGKYFLYCSSPVGGYPKFQVGINGYNNTINVDAVRHAIEYYDNDVLIDGSVVVSFASSSAVTQYPLLLFSAFNNTGGRYSTTPMRQWRTQMWDNGNPVRDFTPIRVGTEGAMIDTLTRRIYRNAGNGAFTYGNDLKYPIPAE